MKRKQSEDRRTDGVLAEATAAAEAARILWEAWLQGARLPSLPERCRPRDRAEGYAIQSELVRLSGQRVAGWKIAATSLAGQRHINVDGPLAGPLLAGVGSTIDLRPNRMRLAEAEFAFRMAAPLPPRGSPYTYDEVKAATASVHPAIEVPDSRYDDVTSVGAPQLIADAACAWWAKVAETGVSRLARPRPRRSPGRRLQGWAARCRRARRERRRAAPGPDLGCQRAGNIRRWPQRRRSRDHGHLHRARPDRARGATARGLRRPRRDRGGISSWPIVLNATGEGEKGRRRFDQALSWRPRLARCRDERRQSQAPLSLRCLDCRPLVSDRASAARQRESQFLPFSPSPVAF